MPTAGWINGNNLRIEIGGKPIFGAKTCKISLSREFLDILNKDTANFKDRLPDGIEWSASCDSDVQFATNATKTLMKDILDAFLAGTSVSLTFTTKVTGDWVLSGSAFIDKFDLDATKKSVVSGAYSFTGSGAITVAAGA